MLTDEQIRGVVYDALSKAEAGQDVRVLIGRALERAVLEQVLQKLESSLNGKTKVDDCLLALSDHRDWLRQMAKGGQG